MLLSRPTKQSVSCEQMSISPMNSCVFTSFSPHARCPRNAFPGTSFFWRASANNYERRRLGDSYFVSALSLFVHIRRLHGMIAALMPIALRPQKMGCTSRAIFQSSAENPVSLIRGVFNLTGVNYQSSRISFGRFILLFRAEFGFYN